MGIATTAITLLVTAALLDPAGHQSRAAPQSPPVLRSSVDLVTIDVQLRAAKDAPLRQFAAADFEIRISGKIRPAASVTFLHFDEGKAPAAVSECVFNFQRKTDRQTAHYVIGIERTEADRREVRDVKVQTVDKGIKVETYMWRSPVRSGR